MLDTGDFSELTIRRAWGISTSFFLWDDILWYFEADRSGGELIIIKLLYYKISSDLNIAELTFTTINFGSGKRLLKIVLWYNWHNINEILQWQK